MGLGSGDMGEIVSLSGYRARRYGHERGAEPAPVPVAATSDHHSQREPLLREVWGGVVRGLRLERGERLTDVAARAVISPQYLSEIERGRKDASSEILAAIARSLDVSVRELSAQVVTRMAQGNSHGPVCLAA